MWETKKNGCFGQRFIIMFLNVCLLYVIDCWFSEKGCYK
jgi:hypothetical protein